MADRKNHDKKSHYKACGGEICFRKDVFVMRNVQHFFPFSAFREKRRNDCWKENALWMYEKE